MSLVSWGCYALCGLTLCLMARQDFRSGEVSNHLCLFGWLVVIGTFCVRSHMLVTCVILALLFVFYELPCELKAFGDADIVPLAMYISFFGTPDLLTSWEMYELMLALLILFFILYPYARFYCKRHNETFKLFKGMYVPAIPAFAIAWCVTTPCLIIWYYCIGQTVVLDISKMEWQILLSSASGVLG